MQSRTISRLAIVSFAKRSTNLAFLQNANIVIISPLVIGIKFRCAPHVQLRLCRKEKEMSSEIILCSICKKYAANPELEGAHGRPICNDCAVVHQIEMEMELEDEDDW